MVPLRSTIALAASVSACVLVPASASAPIVLPAPAPAAAPVDRCGSLAAVRPAPSIATAGAGRFGTCYWLKRDVAWFQELAAPWLRMCGWPSLGLLVRWDAVDGHVGAGLGGELGFLPVGVSGLQLEAGQLPHEIELGGPDVAMGAARYPDSSLLIEPDVVRHDVLTQDVVGVESDAVGVGLPDHGLLAWGKLAQLRHPQFDHESAAGGEVAGVAEAGDLLRLREQV